MTMLAVIVIHVSETWICGLPVYRTETGMMIDEMQAGIACVLKSVSGFAVPCFVMLSGAFNLADERNSEYRYFYRKIFRKIGIHTLIFSVVYFCYRSIFCFIGDNAGMGEFRIVLKDLLLGRPMGHMGYLYRMAVIYLLLPLVFLLKSKTSERIVPLLSMLCFILSIALPLWTSDNRIMAELSIEQTVEYMGYFLLGYVIRKTVAPNMVGGMVCIGLGILIGIRLGIAQYSEIFLGMQDSSFGITTMIAYILIFVGFTMISVPERKIITKLTN